MFVIIYIKSLRLYFISIKCTVDKSYKTLSLEPRVWTTLTLSDVSVLFLSACFKHYIFIYYRHSIPTKYKQSSSQTLVQPFGRLPAVCQAEDSSLLGRMPLKLNGWGTGGLKLFLVSCESCRATLVEFQDINIEPEMSRL